MFSPLTTKLSNVSKLALGHAKDKWFEERCRQTCKTTKLCYINTLFPPVCSLLIQTSTEHKSGLWPNLLKTSSFRYHKSENIITVLQVNNYEIVKTFFISAITWPDIQQLSIYLPEFHCVQLVNWKNNSCKFL